MTYRSGIQQQTEFASPKPSVFSQILVKHYLCDEEPVPKEANQYWWNSKRTVRKKVVLPWNHPLTKETTPKLFGKKNSSPRSRAAKEVAQLTEPREEKPKRSERRCCCCCCCGEEGNEDNNMKPALAGVSDTVSNSVSNVAANSVTNSVTNSNTNSNQNTNTNSLTKVKSNGDLNPDLNPDLNSVASSTTHPNPTLPINVQRRVTKAASMPETEEGTGMRKSTASIDSGMGSFLQDLRRSQAHSVSSMSWRPSSPSSME